MNLSVPHLKRLSKVVRSLSATEGRALSAMLRRRQPHFWQLIEDVGMDPRCVQAHRFCTLFCALAIERAEGIAGSRLPEFPRAAFQEVRGLVARGGEAQLGRAARGYPERIRRYVLLDGDFDEDDTAWLRTAISGFLIVVQGWLGQKW